MNKAMPTIHESPEYLKHLLKHERHPGKRQRLHALYLLASGQATRRSAVAAALGIDRNTVGRWLTRYERGGLATLRNVYMPAGKRPALSPAQVAQLQQALQRPEGFASYDAIRGWIAQTFGVTLTYNAVHKLVRYQLKAKRNVPRPTPINKR